MFTDLPVETVVSILVYLPIHSIHSLKLVSKQLYNLIIANESTIYRSAAAYHGYIPTARLKMEQLGTLDLPNSILEGTEGEWKVFCQRMVQLDNNWQGRGQSALMGYPTAGTKPACIRVDEKEGFIINIKNVSGVNAGLVVVNKEDGVVLWEQHW
ncbi:hypothetical protein PQX77_010230, partial [Marasmius sp. AFHP31]